MTNIEVLEADLLEITGLANISHDERAAFIQSTDMLFGAAGLIQASKQLVEKDQEIFGKLLEQEEMERANALLSMRGIDMEYVFFEEVIRVKRSIIESGEKFHSADELEFAIKALLPVEMMGIGFAESQSVIDDINEMIDGLPLSEESKASFKDTVHNGIETDAELIAMSMLSPEDREMVDEHFENNRVEEAMALMMHSGIDMGEVYNGAALRMKKKILDDFKLIGDIGK